MELDGRSFGRFERELWPWTELSAAQVISQQSRRLCQEQLGQADGRHLC